MTNICREACVESAYLGSSLYGRSKRSASQVDLLYFKSTLPFLLVPICSWYLLKILILENTFKKMQSKARPYTNWSRERSTL